MHKQNQMKIKSGLVDFYAIRPGNGSGLFYSSRGYVTHYIYINEINQSMVYSVLKSHLVNTLYSV